MDQSAARTYLDKLYAADGCKGLQDFARKMGISWTTVYAWQRRANVPEWRLEAFTKAAKRKRKVH